MTTATYTDGRALYAAIAAAPDEDTPRLVYADWLDEHGSVSVKCPECGAFIEGDIVEAVDQSNPLHCGSGTYPEAVVVSVRPFALGSLSGDMLWTTTRQPSSVRKVIRAYSRHETKKAKKRWENDPGKNGVKCDTCKSTGSITDTSNADRAEFIRVQIEREQFPPCRVEPTCEVKNQGVSEDRQLWCFDCFQRELYRGRERELLTAHEATWRKGPVCGKCGGSGKSARTKADGWCFANCPDCDGTGDLGGLTRPPQGSGRWRHRVAFARGFPAEVRCELGEVVQEARETCMACFGTRRVATSDGDREVCCPICHGRGDMPLKWRATDWARRVVWHHPVTRFCVALPVDLPPPVLALIDGYDRMSTEARQVAVAVALATLARKEAANT